MRKYDTEFFFIFFEVNFVFFCCYEFDKLAIQ